jgi:exopolysaccharide biosynthesis polyprenyl glycosylphosphotransferase
VRIDTGAPTLPAPLVEVAPARAAAASNEARGWPRALLTLDVAMLGAAAAVAELGAPRAGIPSMPLGTLLGFPAVVLAILTFRGMYQPRLSIAALDDLRGVLTTTALAAMIVLSVRVFVGDDAAVADQTARYWAFAAVYLVAGRALFYSSELRARSKGESLRPTLVVGAGKVGRLTARRLLDNPGFGLEPVGFLDKEPLQDDSSSPADLPVLGATWDLEQVVREHGIGQVVVTFSTAPTDVLLRLCARCEELGVAVAFVPRFFEQMTQRLTIHHLGGLPIVFARRTNPDGWRFAVKSAVDRIGAAVLLLVLAPVLAACALAVLVSSGRPVVFRQRRVGRDGAVFDMLKLRTMRGDPDGGGEADADWAAAVLGIELGATEEAEDEDRRTKVGRFLRRASLDELPQLFNVLKGEMSLVGPRPERIDYVRMFGPSIYRYGDRHRVKSGVTGWAQVHGLRGRTSLEDRVEWDNHYIENWSLWLDMKILLLTVLAVVRSFRSGE